MQLEAVFHYGELNMRIWMSLIISITMIVISSQPSFAAPDQIPVVNNHHLLPGEIVAEAAGYPAIVKFLLGDRNKPLIVFIPGNGFLARIAYGYPGGQEKDFISYWLNKSGYSFLGISYPIEHPVFNKIYPSFSIKDWGMQAAELSKQYIDQNHLSNKVIYIGWSMGGKTAEAVNSASKKLGLNVIMFISFDGLVPAPNVFAGSAEAIKLKNNNMVDFSFATPFFIDSMSIQNKINSHVIISPTSLEKYFIGSPSLNIQGEKLRYVNGKIIDSIDASISDSGTFDFGQFPWVVIMHGSDPIDYPHIIINTNWGLFMGQKIYREYIFPNAAAIPNCPPSTWREITKIFNNYQQSVSLPINGTHFFFVGEKGAKEAAENIPVLQERLS